MDQKTIDKYNKIAGFRGWLPVGLDLACRQVLGNHDRHRSSAELAGGQAREQRARDFGRKRWGDEHHAWRGDDVPREEGRRRAERRFTADECSRCGSTDFIDRHHVDRNPLNNDPANVAILCRRCHMAAHRA